MHGDEIQKLIAGFEKLNDPNQGLNFRGADFGKRRYHEETGEMYYTRSRPAELTVYGERALFLYEVIRLGSTIAAALRPDGNTRRSTEAEQAKAIDHAKRLDQEEADSDKERGDATPSD